MLEPFLPFTLALVALVLALALALILGLAPQCLAIRVSLRPPRALSPICGGPRPHGKARHRHPRVPPRTHPPLIPWR